MGVTHFRAVYVASNRVLTRKLVAMWTRFIPVYRKARELIQSGKIGEVHSVMADFGAKISEDISRVYDKNLGGSIFLDLGA